MIAFHELVMPNGMLRVCTMNCGQTIGDKRSRADIMRECGDCVDYPNPPSRASIADGLLDRVLTEVERTLTVELAEEIRAHLRSVRT